MDELLSKLYYDPENISSFSSAQKLFEAARIKDETITLEDVKEWLKSSETYTTHFPARKTFPRRQIIAYAKDQFWQVGGYLIFS
jgi:hypothetical protein